MVESKFEVDDLSIFKRICGFNDNNVKKIEDLLGVNIIPRGNILIVKSSRDKNESTMKLLHLMTDILQLKESNYEFEDFDIKYLANTIISGRIIKPEEINNLKFVIQEMGKTIVPRTINQANYISAIARNPITFGTGPAGTGKTFLAVVSAIKMFLKGDIKKIILTRPAVEAGENLGFLPGDLIQKINPYLRPLYDALFELQPYEKITRLMEKESIEIAPLAYMRGRTLNKSFIILDEAQNTTISQMKMFLTRMGNGSKIVISGDETQIDLDKPKHSGLLHVMKILKNIKEISFIKFTKDDITRHPVVEKIVAAYEHGGHQD